MQSLKYLKAPLDLPISEGIPKYFSLRVPLGILRMFFTIYRRPSGHPLLKKIEDFSRFIRWPEASQYFSSNSFTNSAPLSIALTSSRLSSAKRRWFGATLIP
jgi:hypothetical protein